jgi:hypothetical protein
MNGSAGGSGEGSGGVNGFPESKKPGTSGVFHTFAINRLHNEQVLADKQTALEAEKLKTFQAMAEATAPILPMGERISPPMIQAAQQEGFGVGLLIIGLVAYYIFKKWR